MRHKVKWGIIGSGGIARRRTVPEGFVPARNAHLIAVYGTNAATNKEVAQEFTAIACDTAGGRTPLWVAAVRSLTWAAIALTSSKCFSARCRKSVASPATRFIPIPAKTAP